MSRSGVTLIATLVTLALLPAAASAAPLLVNLGDSYASGFQRNGPQDAGRSTDDGYADQLVPLLRAKGFRGLKLVNFGCGGATTGSILTTKGCPVRIARAVGGPRYSTSQVAAAERFIRANRSDVALVTISIGGNDFTRCSRVPSDQAVACIGAAMQVIRKNLSATLTRLRAAARGRVRIVGLTYPNVLLGEAVRGNEGQVGLSTIAFRDIINPTLKELYGAVDARFVDITAGFRGYTPLEQTTTLAPYGRIPVAVAEICRLSYYCRLGDIHLTTRGYGQMARLIAATVPRRR